MCIFLSETGSTELTGLFVEKPLENVVAVAGQAQDEPLKWSLIYKL